jgi:signal transduction histidine kinase/DNA-binding response OmpR family regulator
VTLGNDRILCATDARVAGRVQAALSAHARVVCAATPTAALAILEREGAGCAVVQAAWAGQSFVSEALARAPDLAVVLCDAEPGPDLADAIQAARARAASRRLEREETRRLRRRLEAAEVTRGLALASADRATPAQLLEHLAAALAHLVPFDVAALALAPAPPSQVSLHLHRRTPSDGSTLASCRARCLAELAARLGRPVPDPTHLAMSGLPEGSAPSPPLRGELHLPVEVAGELCGLVTLGACHVGAFSDEDEALASQAVAEVSAAVARRPARMEDERRPLALMVDSMADGVIMTDERSEVFLINPAARRLLGVERDVAVTAKYLKERLGFYPFDLVARSHPAREELAIEQRTLHSVVSPVLDALGRRVGVVVVLRDISAQKALAQRKHELLEGVAQELRTPLTSITGALDLVLTSYAGGLGDKQRTYLGVARDGCTRLSAMVTDLLDFSHDDDRRLRLSFEAVPLDALALESVERFRAAAESKRVTLVATVEPGARGLSITGDADRLSQVMSNLLSNAIKFTPEGGRIEVEVFGPGAAPAQVGVSVWNNGDAIPEDQRDRVFDKLAELHSQRRVAGSGLGLAVSRAIVEGHGGRIWVEHAPVGTKFVFTLPAAAEAPAAAAPVAVPAVESGPVNRLVLVADDDRYDAYLLKGVLMRAGHRVHVLHDLDEALSWARERRPDLCIVEARLGGGDGLALVEILRHDPDTRKAAVVVLSAAADREGALAAGADLYVPKPVQASSFSQACARLLAEKTRESQVKVLVVDDDAAIRMIAREVLETAGYVVREAADGKAALTEAQRFRPDLMLLDVMMPELDGYQTAKRFRADPSGALTPVIFVSARGRTEDKVRAFKLGAEDYLVKPFDALELLARVEKALARRERELGASPTTQLPGAGAIESEIERRLAEGGDFAFCYVDLDNLKAFNDYYGIAKADGVIRQTGDLMRQVVAREGSGTDFIGHIAGDDFVFVTTPERIDRIGQTICRAFDRIVPLYYNRADRERGYIETCDRYGVLRKFPIMSISVAALTTRRGETRFATYAELAGAAAEAKKVAKAIPGSVYVRDGSLVHPAAA